jgi:hypothetical protein
MEENKIFIKQENKSKIFFRKTIGSFFYNHTAIGNFGQRRIGRAIEIFILYLLISFAIAMYINNPNILNELIKAIQSIFIKAI